MDSLDARLEKIGRALGAREADHADALKAARSKAEELHAAIAHALEGFHVAVSEAGAPQFRVALGEARLDDKHIRSFEFDVRRGRYRGIVTVKSRGEVTFVGPFHAGKTEGPCQAFALDASAEIEGALGEFMEAFLEQAATP